jgi:hypothetical protein
MKFGFKKTYFAILFIQTFMCFTMSNIAHNQFLYEIYIILTFMCDSGTMAIFTPFSAQIFGGV